MCRPFHDLLDRNVVVQYVQLHKKNNLTVVFRISKLNMYILT